MKDSNGTKSVFAGFIDALRRDRRLELAVYAALLAAAFIIFAATGGISCTGGSAGCQGARNPSFGAGSGASATGAQTGSETEERLASMLEGIPGAGRVEVMISYYDTGNGAAALLGSYATERQVRGVIVLAEGADSIRVRTDIQTAVRTLLAIEASRVGVYRLEPHD